ncbi:MAG TPA: DMT family transporter [Sphaerochaeta sp.]|nr:DMT family transporter [Sphaerochaeta sp.]
MHPRQPSRLSGHIATLTAITIWAITYVFTKGLLVYLTPSQILVIRSFLGLLVLTILAAKPLAYTQKSDRLLVALAGFFGIFAYYFLENTALLYTSATNVGVIVAAAPFTTMLASRIFLKEQLHRFYFIGLVLSMSGIVLLTVSDAGALTFNPKGDLLALLAITIWALYTTTTRLVSQRGYSNLALTRTMFFWGLIGHTVALLASGQGLPLQVVVQPQVLGPLLFLGLAASALCFALWNYGLKSIGPVKTTFYLYLSPIITIIFATTFGGEPFGIIEAIGTALTLSGLLVSTRKGSKA